MYVFIAPYCIVFAAIFYISKAEMQILVQVLLSQAVIGPNTADHLNEDQLFVRQAPFFLLQFSIYFCQIQLSCMKLEHYPKNQLTL